MIEDQSRAPQSVKHIYDAKIQDAAVHLEPSAQRAARQLALDEIAHMGIDVFWSQEHALINQYLHRAFGTYRLVVHNGTITDLGIGKQR